MTTTLTTPVLGSSATTAASPRLRKRKRSVWFPVMLAVFFAGVLGIAGWSVASWTRVAGDIADVDKFTVSPRSFSVLLKEKGELKAAKSTDIVCEVEGRSTIISLIPEGTAVKKGDLLVELASDEIENRIQQEELKEANAITNYESAKTELDIQRDKNASDVRKALLEIELARLELDKYREGEWAQQMKDAQIAIDQAQMTLERREEDFKASEELWARKYTTQTEHEEAEFNFKKAQWDLEKARMAKSVLEDYTHVAQLKKLESDLEEATKECDRVKKNAEAEEIKKTRDLEGKKKELDLTQEQLAELRRQKEKCRITAPTEGFVVYYSGGGGRWHMSDDSQIKEGAQVFERQILMQVPDTKQMLATVRVHEAKTDRLSMGQSATVTVEGVPGERLTGKVSKIAVVADSQSSWLNPDLKEYETEITLDVTEVPLKPGMTAYAEILVDNVADKLAVPVQSVYTKGRSRYLFVDRSGRVEHVPIELGKIGSEWAEIRSGVAAGDKVLLAFSDDMKRAIPDPQPGERGPGGRGPGGPAGPGGGGRRGERRAGGPSAQPAVVPADGQKDGVDQSAFKPEGESAAKDAPAGTEKTVEPAAAHKTAEPSSPGTSSH